MVENNIDPLATLLFGKGDELINLKLCRGDTPAVTEEELRAEAHFALTQVALGTCETVTDFREDRQAKLVKMAHLAAI